MSQETLCLNLLQEGSSILRFHRSSEHDLGCECALALAVGAAVHDRKPPAAYFRSHLEEVFESWRALSRGSFACSLASPVIRR